MPRLVSARLCQQDGLGLTSLLKEDPESLERFVYDEEYLSAYRVARFCSFVKVSSIADGVQEALSMISKKGANGIPDEQLKDFKKRKLIVNQ